MKEDLRLLYGTPEQCPTTGYVGLTTLAWGASSHQERGGILHRDIKHHITLSVSSQERAHGVKWGLCTNPCGPLGRSPATKILPDQHEGEQIHDSVHNTSTPGAAVYHEQHDAYRSRIKVGTHDARFLKQTCFLLNTNV